jgi:hypothetical protein
VGRHPPLQWCGEPLVQPLLLSGAPERRLCEPLRSPRWLERKHRLLRRWALHSSMRPAQEAPPTQSPSAWQRVARSVQPSGGACGAPVGSRPSGAGGAVADGSRWAVGAVGAESIPPGKAYQGMAPPPQRRVPQARSPCAAPSEAGSGMNGGMPVSHLSAHAPQGIHNLGEALIIICTLTSFPPAQGTPMYEAWDAQIKELTAYIQRRTDTAHSRSRSVA